MCFIAGLQPVNVKGKLFLFKLTLTPGRQPDSVWPWMEWQAHQAQLVPKHNTDRFDIVERCQDCKWQAYAHWHVTKQRLFETLRCSGSPLLIESRCVFDAFQLSWNISEPALFTCKLGASFGAFFLSTAMFSHQLLRGKRCEISRKVYQIAHVLKHMHKYICALCAKKPGSHSEEFQMFCAQRSWMLWVIYCVLSLPIFPVSSHFWGVLWQDRDTSYCWKTSVMLPLHNTGAKCFTWCPRFLK